MKRHAGRNYRDEEANRKPDCCLCIHKSGCERAAENSWCTRFQSREPAPEGPDPNDLWARGEEADF